MLLAATLLRLLTLLPEARFPSRLGKGRPEADARHQMSRFGVLSLVNQVGALPLLLLPLGLVLDHMPAFIVLTALKVCRTTSLR